MNRFYIKCPTCGQPFAAENYNSSADHTPCSMCGGKLHVHAFPALYRRVKMTAAALKATLDEAGCFYHAEKKAEQVCDECGRFLCGLCELPFGEETLCAACLEQRRKKPGQHALTPRQMRYDKLAMILAVTAVFLMLPFWFVPLVPAGMSLASVYVAVRYWKRAPDLAAGYRSWMMIAVLVSIAAGVGAVLFTMFMFRNFINA